MTRNCLISSLAVLILACGNAQSQSTAQNALSVPDYRGKTDQNYDFISDDLVRGEDGFVYFLTQTEASIPVYLKRFGFYNSDFPNRLDPYLSDTIDASSWKQRLSTIYTDKNNVYCRHDLSSGARLFHLDDFNPSTSRLVYVRRGVVMNKFLFVISEDNPHFGADWFLTNGHSYIDIRCHQKTEDEVRATLEAQIAANPPDYSGETGMVIKPKR